MFVVKEMRNFKFSNGYVATAVAETANYSVSTYYLINGRPFNLPNDLTMASRQGIINHIKKNFVFDNKVKVTYEDYCCQIWIPEKKVTLEFKAVPRSEQYTDITVAANSVHIFEGKEKITFNSIRGMQDLALSKFNEYEKQKEMSQNNISKPVTMQKKANTAQQKTNITQQKSGMIKKETSQPNGVIVSSFKEGYAKGVAQKQKKNKTIDTITKFPENEKKKSKTTYHKLGISDEAAARGKMSPTNYILEGLYGKTPKGIKPPEGIKPPVVKSMNEIIKRRG